MFLSMAVTESVVPPRVVHACYRLVCNIPSEILRVNLLVETCQEMG